MTSARENTSCDLAFASRVGNRESQFSNHKLFNERMRGSAAHSFQRPGSVEVDT